MVKVCRPVAIDTVYDDASFNPLTPTAAIWVQL